MSIFDGSQKEVGKGAQATIYYYEGYAYKVYRDDYPREWCQYEINIQNQISKTGLPVVNYYETNEPNIIKMGFIDGITLGERMLKQKYKNGLEDLLSLQKCIQQHTDVDLPTFKSSAAKRIPLLSIDQHKKDTALSFLNEIPEKNNLLHLDFHFLNVMYADQKYFIIDWVNAEVGNPIFDFARSYVLMNEFAYRLSKKYLSTIEKDKEINTTDLKKAIYIMALLRLKESQSDKILALIDSLEKELAI